LYFCKSGIYSVIKMYLCSKDKQENYGVYSAHRDFDERVFGGSK
ncbi:hypothetical protein EZS27_026076, partial [termite gut metagenome]